MSEKSGGEDLSARLSQFLNQKGMQAAVTRWLVVGLFVGVLFLKAGDLFGVSEPKGPPPGSVEVSAAPGAPQDDLVRMEREIGQGLERTLSMVDGAGVVRVTVMLEAGPAIAAVADIREDRTTTKETAADNSTREIITTNKTTTHVMSRSGGGDSPAVARKSRATIAGVLIVAEGARSDSVRARLHRAAVTALGISANRITVIPGKGE